MKRIQLKRTKGWKMPANTAKVDRSTRWGNPFVVKRVATLLSGTAWFVMINHFFITRFDNEIDARANCLARYRIYAQECLDRDPLWLTPLRGKNLACWCREDQSCHADVLLEMTKQ